MTIKGKKIGFGSNFGFGSKLLASAKNRELLVRMFLYRSKISIVIMFVFAGFLSFSFIFIPKVLEYKDSLDKLETAKNNLATTQKYNAKLSMDMKSTGLSKYTQEIPAIFEELAKSAVEFSQYNPFGIKVEVTDVKDDRYSNSYEIEYKLSINQGEDPKKIGLALIWLQSFGYVDVFDDKYAKIRIIQEG